MVLLKAIFLMISAFVPYAFAGIVINELQPAPQGDEPEWIELYNVADTAVAIAGLSVSDAVGTKPAGDISMPARSYALLCRDTAELKKIYDIPAGTLLVEAVLPSLNNTSDEAKIFDGKGRMLDSLWYDMDNFAAGFSIERINPLSEEESSANIAICVDPAKGTPGRKNSVAKSEEEPDGTEGVSVDPNPFTPNGSKTAEKCRISYDFSVPGIRLSARIFTASGLHVSDLLNSVPVAGKGEFYWDGRNAAGYLCDIGAYVLHMEASDTGSDRVFTSVTAIIVGD